MDVDVDVKPDQRIRLYLPSSAFWGQIWEHKVYQDFCSDNSSFTIRCLEDGDSSAMEWKPFKNMSTFNFKLAHLHECIAANKAAHSRQKSRNFASFIICEPNKPLLNTQIAESRPHILSTSDPKLLQELLSPSDAALKPLCSSLQSPGPCFSSPYHCKQRAKVIMTGG